MEQLTLFPKAKRSTVRPIALRELPDSERPTNRLFHYGPMALSTTELLAILLGSQLQLHHAAELLATFDDLVTLGRAASAELQQVDGIGPAGVARIKAALELGRRLSLTPLADRPQVRSPADAANLVMATMSILEQEHLVALLLDTKNRVLDIPTIYVGSLNMSLIRVGEVFKPAIRQNANSLIAVHNHPSGDPTPSPEDVAVTNQIREAGNLMDIELLDHLIIGHNRFCSLKERGLGF